MIIYTKKFKIPKTLRLTVINLEYRVDQLY